MVPKRIKKKNEEFQTRMEAARLKREETEIGKIKNLIDEYEIPGSMSNPINGYVMFSESEHVKHVFEEWRNLKNVSDAAAALVEIQEKNEEIRVLKWKLNEIRRIVE